MFNKKFYAFIFVKIQGDWYVLGTSDEFFNDLKCSKINQLITNGNSMLALKLDAIE
jgi:hypothetical protein